MYPPVAPQTANVRSTTVLKDLFQILSVEKMVKDKDLPVHNRCSQPLECNPDVAKSLSHLHPFKRNQLYYQ